MGLKKFIIIIAMLFGSMCTHAAGDSLTFAGLALVDGVGQFSYKLCVQDSAGTLRGYSVMDLGGRYETKTSIRGSSDGKFFSIRESQVIYTRSQTGAKDLCFVHAQLRLSAVKGVPLLKGSFKGYRADGKTSCAKGSLSLYQTAQLLRTLEAMAPPRDSSEPPVDARVLDALRKQPKPTDTFLLASGRTWRIRTGDTAVSLDLWDNQVDGDVISVVLNGQQVSKLSLNETLQSVSLPLRVNQTNHIEVIAVSEGNQPPNTGMIRLRTTKGKAEAMADLRYGEKAVIQIDCFPPSQPARP